jgi:hypothetical protein
MLKTIRENKLLFLLLLLGLVCALVLCAQRVAIESADTLCCVVMTQEDADLLSYKPDSIGIFSGEDTISGALLLVEDGNQYSFEPIDVVDTDNITWGTGEGTAAVRCFKLTEKYAAKYATLGYDGAEEIENILYRAVTDRNIRVLWLTPFVDSQTGEVITDGGEYEQLIENLSERVAPHGITLTSDEFSLLPAYSPNRILLCGVLLGILAAGALVVLGVFEQNKWRIAFFMLFFLGFAGLRLVMDSTHATALVAACVFPCLSLWQFALLLDSAPVGAGLGKKIGYYLRTLLWCFAPSLCGGLFVAAIQSDTGYLLAAYNFSGVKLSQLVPICFAVFVIFKLVYGKNGCKDILYGEKKKLFIPIVVVLAVIAVFLLRTGDGILAVSSLEQRLRNLLERWLIVRPRTKEFAVAWVCAAIALALFFRDSRRWAWIFAILTSVGFSSVVNTFCHSRAPVWLSTTRGVLGLLIGGAIGCVILCVFDLFGSRRAEK